MNNVKLNDEQIEELKNLYRHGYCYLCRNYLSPNVNALTYKTNKIEERGVWNMAWDDNAVTLKNDYDFVKWEDNEPFYFIDLFEVVYKGEV